MFYCLFGNVTRRVIYCWCAFVACDAQGIRWADNAFSSEPVEDVRVDHRGLHVFVSEEFLDGPDVVSGHQQVSGEGVAESVAAHSLVDPCVANGLFYRPMDDRVVQVMAAGLVGPGIGASGAGREHVLPAPVGGGVWVLAVQGGGEMDAAEAIGDVLFVEFANVNEVVPEPVTAGVGEEGAAIFVALAVSDGDVPEVEVDILNSELEALEDAHAGAIEQENDELDGALQAGKESRNLFAAKDGWESLWLPCTDNVIDPRRIDLEDFAVEEEQGAHLQPGQLKYP